MDATAFLRELTQYGYAVSRAGDRLLVSPKSRVNERLRARLRTYKPALLALLADASEPPSSVEADTDRSLPRRSDPPPLSEEEHEAILEAIAERAAIREMEGSQSRSFAEREARAAMRVYRVLLETTPGRAHWATLILPGCNQAEATTHARRRWRSSRILALVTKELDEGDLR
ncbi:hypothetical protein G3480_24995 [Thiorhodococcus mannitoliphagus]|uniref:TubC N-terminal docking domain-containing protein n=1 Tax=Thiorhodococcus mannitoliphagus TaxID=329406 RepID=A0A6P1E127_9GAMM|nr:hypothetical protein [Thiorhodococcus mannitoliphagus]NEX23500.1 hypothetical protein [Thiorhodococcus mannitoliphagus]